MAILDKKETLKETLFKLKKDVFESEYHKKFVLKNSNETIEQIANRLGYSRMQIHTIFTLMHETKGKYTEEKQGKEKN